MTWYLKNAVGAGSLALTDGSSLASAWNEYYHGQALYVYVYTFTSGGTGTLRAFATLNTLSDPMDFSVTFGSDVAVPDGGSVRVLLDDEYGQAPRWWQTSALTDHSIKAGTWTVRFDRSPPAVALLVGGGVSFIDGGFLVDDTVVYTPTSIAQHDSRHTDITFDTTPVEAAVEDAANWSCDNSVAIIAAEVVSWDTKTVRLTHSKLTKSTTYTFTADNDITADGNKTIQVTSAVDTPNAMTLESVISRDSQHTDYAFSYEVADAYLTGTYFTCPNSASFTSATKQADPRIVRVKHANVANGDYTGSVSSSLKSVFGETCAITSKSVTVALQHDSTTVGLRHQGVYNGVLLGAGPAGEVRLAYVGANSLTVGVYRSNDGTTYSKVNDVWPSSGLSGWAAGTQYRPWSVITEGGRTYQAVRVLGKTAAYQGKSHASTEPTWPTTAGATVDDKTSDATNGESYAGGTYYGVVWQENTSVTVAAAVAEGSNYAYIICDRRPCYRDEPVENGGTGYYKVTVDGGSNFTDAVTVTPNVNTTAQESLRLYKWRVNHLYVGKYQHKPFGLTGLTATNPAESAYAGGHIAALGYAYYLTDDDEFLWLIDKQLAYLVTCQHGTTGDDRWLDATAAFSTASPWDVRTAVDHNMRSVLLAYIGAKHLERAGETTRQAAIKERVDIWAAAFVAKFATSSITLTNTGPVGAERSDTEDGRHDFYTRSTLAPVVAAEWTPNQHMSDAALFALLYTDSDSAYHESATALAQLGPTIALSRVLIDSVDGEQKKVSGTSATAYYNHGYALFNNMLAIIVRHALPSEDWPDTLDADVDAVYAWTTLDVPAWTASESGITAGTLRKAPAGNRFIDGDQHFIYVASEVTTGTCGSSEPTWPITQGGTVVDGGVTWKARLSGAVEPVQDVNYPGRFDGDFFQQSHTEAGWQAAQMRLMGDYAASWVNGHMGSAAYVDPDTLKSLSYTFAVNRYSPSGFPAFGDTANATYYNDSQGGAFSLDGNYIYEALFAIPAAPSDVTATFDTDHVDVAFTDNSATESGIKWKRKVDGGEWSAATTVATPDTTSFTDSSLPESWTTLQYAVASYNDAGDSAWVESNEVSVGGCPVWLLRHHSNLDLAWRH